MYGNTKSVCAQLPGQLNLCCDTMRGIYYKQTDCLIHDIISRVSYMISFYLSIICRGGKGGPGNNDSNSPCKLC